MTTKTSFQKIEELLKEIRDFVADGEYIFRGETQKNPKVSSNLYREFETAMKAKHFDINVVQEEILRNVKKHTKKKDNDMILEQLQHFGGKTNQIDFTPDYLIALFFACDGKHKKHGRLIFLDRKKLKEPIHEPTHPENRVIAQKSIFVRPPTGTVKPDKEITIDKELKEPIILYLDKHHNINTQTIYNDIHGYIIRHKSHESAYTDFYIGLIYQNEQKDDLAIEHYTKSLDDQKTPEAYNNRGNVYDNKGDYDKAIADYDKAIKLNPNHAEAYNNRGNVYDNKGDYDKAFANYNKAIEINPNYAEAYNNRAVTYHNRGNHEAAIIDYDKAIKINPNYAEAHNNRGVTYHNKGDYDIAIIGFNKAIELNPNLATAYSNRGVSYRNKGDYDKAITDMNKAIKQNPDINEAYFHRSIIYQHKGEHDKAIADLNKAIELKQHPDIRDHKKIIHPDNAMEYCIRGLAHAKKDTPDNKAAKKDFQHALNLAKEQGNKPLAARISQIQEATLPAANPD